jgi:putative tryptophan/tyrosine transport system substrate-binding protein
VRRREFLVGFGFGAMPAAFGFAQQSSTPIIGWSTATPETARRVLSGFRKGLTERGYIEGQNFRFDIQYSEYKYDLLPGFFRSWIDRRVTLIIASSTRTLVLAKAATQSIPIVFTIGSDPVENGFVTSLNKPGANITGVFTLNLALAGKRLELLRELVPSARKFAFLTNPGSPKFNEPETREIQAAARSLGVDIIIVNAQKPDEFEAAIGTASREGAGGIVIGSEALFIAHPARSLTGPVARNHLPAIYGDEQPVTAEDGLISYGADQDEGYRLVGEYAARVLKGEQPSNIPVQQSTRTKLVINLKTAAALRITVPTSLLGRAEEVIE